MKKTDPFEYASDGKCKRCGEALATSVDLFGRTVERPNLFICKKCNTMVEDWQRQYQIRQDLAEEMKRRKRAAEAEAKAEAKKKRRRNGVEDPPWFGE